MAALMNEFHESGLFEGEGADVGAGLDSQSSNDPHYNTAPEIDPLMTLRQVAQPNQDSANQPSATAEQARAMEQREQLTSKAPNVGNALGAGDKGGVARMESAQKEMTKVAEQVAKLDKQIAGGQPETPSAKGSFKSAVVGQGIGAAAAVGATIAAGPAVGAAVAVAATAYDVAAVFSGRSGGGSSFKSSADSSGYASSAPAQPAAQAAPVSTAFMQNMMNIPGERKIGAADVELASEGLNGIKKAPPLEMTPVAVAMGQVYKNGLNAALSRGEENDKDAKLDLKVAGWKPTPPGNPGVFMPTPAGVV